MAELDISATIGPLYPIHSADNPPEWPMYSFDRPATILWNEIANRLMERGWSEKRIKEWLQSKDTRWALDGSLGDALRDLARSYADTL